MRTIDEKDVLPLDVAELEETVLANPEAVELFGILPNEPVLPAITRWAAAYTTNRLNEQENEAMAGLWSRNKAFKGGKFLVLRRDGSQPEWPYFVLGARDPAAPAGLQAYADKAEELCMDPEYVSDIRALARAFEEFRLSQGSGDPDAPPHRKDDPKIVAMMAEGFGA